MGRDDDAHRQPRGPVRRLFRLGVGEPDAREAVEWEVEHHLSEATDRLVEEGWDPAGARAEAERRFGRAHRPRITRIERRRRRMRTMGRGVEAVRDAVGGALRTLRRSPGFAAAVVGTLALGIGANAAVFGIVDRLLLQPPAHIDDAERVKRFVLQRGGPGAGTQTSFTRADVADWEDARSFEAVAGLSHLQSWTLVQGEDAREISGRMATWDLFPLLGVEPRMGRFFTEDEDRPGAPLTAVVGQEFWEGAWGADPDVLGRTVEIGGHTATVIGVAPDGFTGVDLEAVDVWLPLDGAQTAFTGGTEYRDHRGWWWMKGVGRLAAGVEPEAAAAEVTGLHLQGRAEQVEQGYGADHQILVSGLVSGEASGYAAEGRVVQWLAGVSLVVLLIACANVANLLLARGARRRREVAVRLAMGVSRARLVGQMTVQTVLLALLGGIVAVGVAAWGGQALQRVLLPDVAAPGGGLGVRALVFALGVSVLAGLLAGVPPALQSLKGDVAGDLKEGRRGSSGRSGLRSFLASAQAAMSVVLLVGAGLFIQSLHEVRSVDLGLDVDRLLLGSLELESSDPTPTEVNALHREAARRVAGITGVEGVTLTHSPFRYNYAQPLRVAGLDSIPRMPGGGPYVNAVSPTYFETVGLSIVEGRPPGENDRAGAAPVAWVSRTMADSLWKAEGALGQCLLVGADAESCTTVVGVVEEASRGEIEEDTFFAYYLPLDQTDQEARGIYVRTRDPGEAVPAVARELRAFSAEVRYARVESLREILDPQARSWSLGATMFSVFGILALVVAAVGLYSLLAFQVAERTRELGIRSALGAARGRLLGSVVARGARLMLAGVVLGLGVAWFAAPLLQDLLFRVSPRNPAVLVGVAAVLLAVSLLASVIPALRATRVHPAEALRTE
jgi:predicted permease